MRKHRAHCNANVWWYLFEVGVLASQFAFVSLSHSAIPCYNWCTILQQEGNNTQSIDKHKDIGHWPIGSSRKGIGSYGCSVVLILLLLKVNVVRRLVAVRGNKLIRTSTPTPSTQSRAPIIKWRAFDYLPLIKLLPLTRCTCYEVQWTLLILLAHSPINMEKKEKYRPIATTAYFQFATRSRGWLSILCCYPP